MNRNSEPTGDIIGKENLKTGDILFCNGRRLISKAIRKVSKGDYSHVATVVVAYGQVLIVESQRRGVNIIPYDAWQDKYDYQYDVARPKFIKNRTNQARRAFRHAGVAKYDFKMLLFDYPRYVITGKWRGDNEVEARSDRRFTCSTFVGWLFKMPNWWKLSPQQVFDHCYSSNEYMFL